METQEMLKERKPIVSTKKLASEMNVGDEIIFHANGYIETVSKQTVGADGRVRKPFINANDIEIVLDKETGEKLVYKKNEPVHTIILLGDDSEKYNISLSNSSAAFKLLKRAEYEFKKQTGDHLGYYALTIHLKLVELSGASPVLSLGVDRQVGKKVFTPSNTGGFVIAQ